MKKRNEVFQDQINRLFIDVFSKKKIKTITIQVTEDCNLNCSYCYQINKSEKKITFETVKKFIDLLLSDEDEYINTSNTFGIVLDFIGGEPLLEIKLIEQICHYVLNTMIKNNHPWLHYLKFSFSSNGTLYFTEDFQRYLKTFYQWISFGITVDGSKELHDSCRLFPDGSGSYDLAMKANIHYRDNYATNLGSKITLFPSNLSYLSKSFIDFVNKGFYEINANCVFENVWSLKDATLFYYELKKIADFLLDNDLNDKIYFSLLDELSCAPTDINDDRNWCGGDGSMLAINHSGNLYPCLRYMESSLGNDIEPIIIGHVNRGIGITDKEKDWIKQLQNMTTTSQSTDECIDCPIGRVCSWCSAYNYQYYKKLNKRATFICDMHKARALANVYYWNKYYKSINLEKKMRCFLEKNDILRIIPEEEYNYLLSLIKK